MRVSRWVSGAAAAAGLVAAVVGAGVVQAQQSQTFPMSITENRVQGVAGSTSVTPMGGNQLRVEITLTGLRPNAQHAAHIHTAAGARCDTGAPVTYPLTQVRADASGRGTSVTTVTLTADKPINANNAYANVHTNPDGGPGIICANITASYAAQAAGAAPQPQRPAGQPAAPAAQRPAAAPAGQPAPARPAAPPAAPATLPRAGATATVERQAALFLGIAAAALAFGAPALIAVRRRR